MDTPHAAICLSQPSDCCAWVRAALEASTRLRPVIDFTWRRARVDLVGHVPQPLEEVRLNLRLIMATSEVREETQITDGEDHDGVPSRADFDAHETAAELSIGLGGGRLHVVPSRCSQHPEAARRGPYGHQSSK